MQLRLSVLFPTIPGFLSAISSPETLTPFGLRTSFPSFPSSQDLTGFNLTYSQATRTSSLKVTSETVVSEGFANEADFIEIGYICNVHGVQGELRVKPTTDFPELRFSRAGRRWLRLRISGKEIIQEIELTGGRGHPGQKSWIISIRGVNDIDKARQFVGSTLLVREGDRPVLQEEEFYIPDLIGMRVILKETGNLVGTVVNVFNSGANDLLQVRLVNEVVSNSSKSESTPDRLVWIPFVEAIVPDVDLSMREMHITPPKGLLELNLRPGGMSKKERRQMEWKKQKRTQRKLITAKKKLVELGQQHILHELSSGDKLQTDLLVHQILGLNFNLFEKAVCNVSLKRYDLTEFNDNNPVESLANYLKIQSNSMIHDGNNDNVKDHNQFFKRGQHLLSSGKVAMILVMEREDNVLGDSQNVCCSDTLNLLESIIEKLTQDMELHNLMPLIVVSPSDSVSVLQNHFQEHDYFGFNRKKIWFLEEETLPIVSGQLTEDGKLKIALNRSGEIIQSPIGSGGIFSLLSSQNILDELSEMAVEYMQICSLNKMSNLCDPLFVGFAASQGAYLGLKTINDADKVKESDIIFSMPFFKKITQHIDQLQFQAIVMKQISEEFHDSQYTTTYQLRCSIYSSLKICPLEKICIMYSE